MAEEPRQEEYRRALWDKIPRELLIGLAIVGVVLIVVVGLWAFVRPTDPTEKKDFLQAVGVLLAALVGLGGLYFSWRNLNQTRQSAQRTLELTEQGQITERYSQAIDQLGSENRGKILGAVYSLERVARADRDYHWPVMEMLAIYVRTEAPRKRDEEFRQEKEAVEVQPPEPAIQAILTVIGRRSPYHRDVEYGSINLSETNLQGANLWTADLKSAYLRGANLKRVDLRGADLQGTNLQYVDLQGANLQYANLRQASLQGADLRGAKVTDEQLADTQSLEGATMPDGQKYEDWLKSRDSGKLPCHRCASEAGR